MKQRKGTLSEVRTKALGRGLGLLSDALRYSLPQYGSKHAEWVFTTERERNQAVREAVKAAELLGLKVQVDKFEKIVGWSRMEAYARMELTK